jgi:hypothetical protein
MGVFGTTRAWHWMALGDLSLFFVMTFLPHHSGRESGM